MTTEVVRKATTMTPTLRLCMVEESRSSPVLCTAYREDVGVLC